MSETKMVNLELRSEFEDLCEIFESSKKTLRFLRDAKNAFFHLLILSFMNAIGDDDLHNDIKNKWLEIKNMVSSQLGI